jgi:hypothetical protein
MFFFCLFVMICLLHSGCRLSSFPVVEELLLLPIFVKSSLEGNHRVCRHRIFRELIPQVGYSLAEEMASFLDRRGLLENFH